MPVALYERYHEQLLGYCTRFLRDHDRAQDVMQELWERVMRLYAGGREIPGDPFALLLTIARNLCLDDRRRRRPFASLADVGEDDLPAFEIPEPTYMEEVLHLALPRLKQSQRDVMRLYLAGYAVDEIARISGKPSGAVKMLAMRARARLRELIVETIEREHLGIGRAEGGRRPRR